MSTWLSSELGKVKVVRNGMAPHLRYTIASTSWLLDSHLPEAIRTMGQLYMYIVTYSNPREK